MFNKVLVLISKGLFIDTRGILEMKEYTLAYVSRLNIAWLTSMLTDVMGGSLKFSPRPWTAHMSSQPQKNAEESVPLISS